MATNAVPFAELADGDVVLVAPVRTPIGRFTGGLSGVRPDDLAALVIAESVRRSGLQPDRVEDVFFGCANQAGEDNRNVARMALLLAGLPESVPGVTVNRLCASGLEAVNQAVRAARCGDGDLFIAGGVESMSRAPYSMPRGPQMPKAGNVTIYDTSLGWRYPNPKMEAMFPLEAMGCTAENIVDDLGITREDQDAFALASHQKAIAAQEAGAFEQELLPVVAPAGRRQTITVSQDEGPRPGTSLEKLARLRAAFRAGGSVTAGNSSTLNDGAAAVVVATAGAARAMGMKPMARVRSVAAAGVDPVTMGYGPVPASRKALKRAGLTVDDIDLVELNEAFAAQSIGCIRKLGLEPSKVNVHGGAIALGHPLGCSGTRILVTLLHSLERHDKRLGLAALCVGVGQGVATIVERVHA
ncbi:MAG: acetyl-CoA C-acyltransferase [Deltaproteobacteria bacterium]|nr:acetyl-CoA C-acyltransferase [Deltaproteobacteria bacterium]HCH64831.1 3-oxoadipyl-CoA thiolase [Deltaproteobacteria bacterium]